MALTYVGGKTRAIAGTTSTTSISLTDLTGGVAAAPAAGDIVIVGYGVGSTADEAPGVTTAGYTEEQELYSDSTEDTNLSVSWKIMGGSPDTSVVVSGTGDTANAGVVAIHVWRGVDAVTPLDVAETVDSTTGSDRPNPPAITPVTVGAVVIAIGAGAAGSGAVFTSSDLSNFITETSPDVVDCTIGMGSIAWTSGAVNPAQFGGGAGGNANRSWAAVTLALRPDPINAVTGTASGTATASGASAAVAPRTGSAAGAAIAAGTSAAIVPAAGTAAASASVSGASAAVAQATGSAAGAATVSGVGEYLGVTGSADGAATVIGASAAVVPADGSSAGAASVAGVGGSIAEVTGAANGSGSAAGAAESVATVSGSAAGAAATSGMAQAIWVRSGASFGAASVVGESDHLLLIVRSPIERLVLLTGGSAAGRRMELRG